MGHGRFQIVPLKKKKQQNCLGGYKKDIKEGRAGDGNSGVSKLCPGS